MKTLSNTLFMVACLGGVASGNAFNINEHDARVSGRGGASVASNTTASSVSFNPGGIPIAEGTQVIINASLYLAEGSYQLPTTGKIETDSPPSLVPAFYITHRLTDMFAVGLGVQLPFGLTVSWPEGHPQDDIIQDQTLRTYFITPSIGVNLNKYVPGLSIGGGLDIVPATVQLENVLPFGTVNGTADLGGDAVGVGGRFGVMYHPPQVPGLKVGVMYRSQVSLDFDGTGDFDAPEPFRQALPPDGDVSTTLKMPMSVWGGIAYSAPQLPQLEVELNAVWLDWSAFDEIRINLPGTNAMGEPNVQVSPQDYEDTLTWRIGVEYQLNKKTALRAGFIYDPTPIPRETQSARLPDIDRKNVSFGGSYDFGPLAAHLGFLWVTPGERDTTDQMPRPPFAGTYGVEAFVMSLMVSGQLGAK
jgi:long-chain fatty acid transport protein